MSKLLSLFFLIFSLVACSGTGDTNTSQTPVVISKDNFGQLTKVSNIVILDTGSINPTAVAISADGALAAVAYPEGVALVTLSDNSIRTIIGHEDTVNDVAFSPDSSLLATSSRDGTVKIWNVTSGEIVTTFTNPREGLLKLISFSPDGRQVVASADSTLVYIFDATSGEQLAELTTPVSTTIDGVSFMPDGESLVIASSEPSLRVFTIADNSSTLHKPLNDTPATMIMSTDGTRAVVASYASGLMSIYSLIDGKTLAQKSARFSQRSLAFNFDSTLFVGIELGKIIAYHGMTAEPIGTELDNGGTIADIAFSADGKTLAVTSMIESQIVLTLWRVNG